MAHRVTWHLRLLSQLKCFFLTALRNHQQISELYLYDALNLLSCMPLDVKDIQFIFLHHKDKLSAVLDYPRNFENAAKEGLKRTTHWEPYYFERKHLLQQCVSAMSDRKQRWRELELPRCT